MDQRVSIIVPVIRPLKAQMLKETIKAYAGVSQDFYEIVMDEDTNQVGAPKMVKHLVDKSQYPLVMFLGDDTIPQRDFLKNALAAMGRLQDGWGLVGLNDQHHDGNNLATHWLADKRLLEHLDGEFFHTGYKHLFCDMELTDRAKEIGRYVWAEDAIIVHDHPMIKDIELYGAYAEVYDGKHYQDDMLLYCRRKRERISNGFKLGIGLPLVDEKVYTSFFDSWVMMERPDFVYLRPQFPGGPTTPIADIRNSIVMEGLQSGCTHIMQMDTDQTYPPDTITKLLAHDKPMIAAIVHRRYPPFDPILYRGPEVFKYKMIGEAEWNNGSLVEVDATGSGCVIVAAEVYEQLRWPWYETNTIKGRTIGEDIWFCSRVRANDFPIYVDCSLNVGHISLTEVNKDLYFLYKALQQTK